MSSELDSLLAVSRAVAHGRDLRMTLNGIAREAARAAGARAASILLQRAADEPFDVAGAFQLGPAYASAIEQPTRSAWRQAGPSWLAVEEDRQVVVEDTLTDERYEPWRAVSEAEGYRGFVSTPLRRSDRRAFGTLDVYRAAPGPWPRGQLKMLALFARHAATALQTAQLIDRQRQQVRALRRMVSTLEEQGHEHANRLHTVAGLLALGEPEMAQRFVASLTTDGAAGQRRIAERVHEPVLRGLLVAQREIAEQRGVKLRVTDRSQLLALPPTLDEAAAVTVLGNLLDNAIDAVAEQPAARRRIDVSLTASATAATWRVRDYGAGVPEELRATLFERGRSGKPDHRGVGLSLVAEAVERAGGRIAVRHLKSGTSFVVTLPLARAAATVLTHDHNARRGEDPAVRLPRWRSKAASSLSADASSPMRSASP